ncbi:hypothetical protein [Ensifer sp. 4252]|uniref:hypothetical protein n=1 Tax=Ensifer sp. 4252 TaxID=3373915 RepID=UPI003D213BE5
MQLSAVPVSNAQRVQNLVNPVVIEPIGTDILVDGKVGSASLGMTVTIEIKTGAPGTFTYHLSKRTIRTLPLARRHVILNA